MKRFILLTIIFTLPLISGQAQNGKKKNKIKTTSNYQKNIKIKRGRPSIYITFEKFGKWQPLREDESGDGVVLRFHNNLRYSIIFCAFGISQDNEPLIMYSKNTKIGVQYDVELNPIPITEEQKIKNVPIGYNVGSTCHELEIKPGKSFLFTVPKEHLQTGLRIKIPFRYEWEDLAEEAPVHFAYFNSLDIPKQ